MTISIRSSNNKVAVLSGKREIPSPAPQLPATEELALRAREGVWVTQRAVEKVNRSIVTSAWAM